MSAVTTEPVVSPPTFAHHYLSTGCLHGEHVYCASEQGQAGTKKPATCKFCDARCMCTCHPWSST